MTGPADEKLARLAHARWKARTNLFWLATEVLGYKDISLDVHYPLLNILQRFPAPPPGERAKYDDIDWTRQRYTPYVPMRELDGSRRRLILDPRGMFKTTVNVICHTVQWILNYPDIAVLIVHAKQEVAEDILGEIKAHFQSNRILREMFPEYCPPANKRDFGTRQKFTVPNRTQPARKRKEPTVGISSIDTAVAGYHYDVIKFTDIVCLENSGTKDQLQKVAYSFGMYRNVLVKPTDWIDVEGTRYHFSDLYGRIIDGEQKKPQEERRWAIHIRGIYKKDTKGKPYTFTPEEMADCDYLRDAAGTPVSWFPTWFPVSEMELERQDPATGEFLFASQRLNNPVDTSDEKPFPIKLIKWKSRLDMSRVPMAYYTTTVDTAETQGASADSTAIVTCGWDQFGRCYVVDIRHGKMMPDAIIRELFIACLKYEPVSIRIEETGFVRGLKPSIRRQEDLMGRYLPFDFIPRDNQVAKAARILNTLQPWYRRGEIIFCEDLACREALEQELTRFPAYKDDILDALADQFQNRDWFGRNNVRKDMAAQMAEERAKPNGAFDPLDVMGGDNYYDRTGGL
jgi:predicted phage terminase large subunit-like protein